MCAYVKYACNSVCRLIQKEENQIEFTTLFSIYKDQLRKKITRANHDENKREKKLLIKRIYRN